MCGIFICNHSISITPQAYLTHNVKDTFSYASSSLSNYKKLSDAYALMSLLFVLMWPLAAIYYHMTRSK